MPGEHQGLQRKDECLEPENQGVHQCYRIDDVQEQPTTARC
jgi:hypothetical protein